MAVRLDIHYAKCSKCDKNVGCSCQLKNGLCPSCYAASISKP